MSLLGGLQLAATSFHDRYRTVDEACIIQMMLLAGWAYEMGDPASAQQAREALQDWIESGLPCRTSADNQRSFDPAEVWTVMKRLAREGRDPHFRRRQMRTWQRLVDDFGASCASSGPFALEYRRTFDLSRVATTRPLRLRLPVPIERAHRHRLVTRMPDMTGGEGCLEADRIEIRCAPHAGVVTLAVRLDFFAPSSMMADEDRDIYLRPREGLIVVSDRISQLAHSLAKPGSTVRQAVTGFWTFLIENFVCAPIHYDQIDSASPCDWVLDTGLYDCQLGAAILVAMCRARNIPARIIGGHFLYHRAPTNHFWAEYLCPDDGWRPVDFIGWDLSCGGADPVWRDCFFGKIDARLITQCLPSNFTGALGIPIPPAWHMLQTARGEGVEIALTALDGRPVYTDLVNIIDQADT
jgi:hypothetical protein